MKERKKILSGTRKATEKKGLRKLALFGIENTIEITTVPKFKMHQKEHIKMKITTRHSKNAVERYAGKVRENSDAFTGDDHPMMGAVFGVEKGAAKLLSVTQKYKRPEGSDFKSDTLENIENGQRELSHGAIRGYRNPIAHEEHNDLREFDLFSERDYLNALNILSHLFKRLDDAIENSEDGE